MVPAFTEGGYTLKRKISKGLTAKDLTNDAYALFLSCFFLFCFFLSDFLYESICCWY